MKVYYCKDWSKWQDTITGDYLQAVGTISNQNGYIQTLNLSDANPELRFPSVINLAGDSDSDYCDYFNNMNANDYTIPLYGGTYSSKERAGIFHWNCAHESNESSSQMGSRLSRSFRE